MTLSTPETPAVTMMSSDSSRMMVAVMGQDVAQVLAACAPFLSGMGSTQQSLLLGIVLNALGTVRYTVVSVTTVNGIYVVWLVKQ